MSSLQISDFRFQIELGAQVFRDDERLRQPLLRDHEFLPRSGYDPEPRVASTLGNTSTNLNRNAVAAKCGYVFAAQPVPG